MNSTPHSTEGWSSLVRRIEEEALAIRGIVGDAAKMYIGREHVHRFVRVPVLPERCRNQPRSSRHARA